MQLFTPNFGYLIQACQAVQYVKSKIPVTGNSDFIATGGKSEACVDDMRSYLAFSEAPATNIERRALSAELNGCGNCDEQAAAAFVYLRERGVVPLERMHMINYDHAFVALNRQKNSLPEIPATWGSGAVICDPWLGAAYMASQLTLHWSGGIPKSDYRIG